MAGKNEVPATVGLVMTNRLLREGVLCLLSGGGFEVIAHGGDTQEVLGMISGKTPDLFLVEAESLPRPGKNLADLAFLQPTPAVALLVREGKAEGIMWGIRQGVQGYLSLGLSADDFVRALHILVKGDMVVSGDLCQGLRAELAYTEDAEVSNDLSGREQQVLKLVGVGATNREIAEELTVTEHTVKAHLRHILSKLDLRNRQQIAAYAVQEGLLDNDSGHQ